jgi:hypothetical protein
VYSAPSAVWLESGRAPLDDLTTGQRTCPGGPGRRGLLGSEELPWRHAQEREGGALSDRTSEAAPSRALRKNPRPARSRRSTRESAAPRPRAACHRLGRRRGRSNSGAPRAPPRR